MPYLPHKITTTALLLSLIAGSLSILPGCAGTGDRHPEFKPPVYPAPPLPPLYIFERTLRSSFDVKEASAADKFKQFATGTGGSGFALNKPFGVAAFQGRVYVTDTVQRAIFMFDPPNKTFKVIGNEGVGQVLKPLGIDIDKFGNVYVADNSAKNVAIFDKDGVFLRNIGDRTELRRPSGVAVSPDADKVYIIDTGGVDTQEYHRLLIYSADGELIKSIGTRGAETSQFNLPLQVATDKKDGTVYVVDSGNFRVQVFTPDGEYKATIGQLGRFSGQFARPKGIAVDRRSNIYVVDTSFGNFQIFDPKGQLLMFIGQRDVNDFPGNYMLPAGIHVDEDGRIYVVDQYFQRVDVFRPTYLQQNEGSLAGAPLKEERYWKELLKPM